MRIASSRGKPGKSTLCDVWESFKHAHRMGNFFSFARIVSEHHPAFSVRADRYMGHRDKGGTGSAIWLHERIADGLWHISANPCLSAAGDPPVYDVNNMRTADFIESLFSPNCQ